MDIKQLETFRKLIERVVYSRTKSDAKPHVATLDFAVSQARSILDPYFAGKLREAANYAKEASGQVKNKEHWISCMERSWYVFASHVRQRHPDN
jgi:hypothetical protein